MAKSTVNIVMIVAVLVGAFLILNGIGGLAQADSLFGRAGRALGTRSSSINLLVAILELAAGVIVVMSQFASLGKLDGILKLLAFVAWAVVIVLVLFVGNLAADTLAWWITLVESAIILAVLWLVRGDR